ncbi:hypothetical protein QTP70_016164 [Hemibagrus guttatus]|uniref:GH18 domain-containing protein n=1 Tax=Hemibagrus guttatus TaxID=175788 RepID=A0AAE0QCQ1_9TELE|nr:hypothetical protein QTP70_016164 [Hemibagrus guttatus]
MLLYQQACTAALASSIEYAKAKTKNADHCSVCLSGDISRNPALKTLLSVEVKQSRLELLSQQQITLDKFINSTLKYVKKNNYDGVDLTWLENDTDATPMSTKTLTSFIKDSTVSYWQDKVDPKKLILALPAIVQQPQKRQSISQSRIGGMNPERTVEQMNGPVLIIEKQVCQAIKSGQKELKTLTKLESVQNHGVDMSWLPKGFGGVGVVMLDIDNFLNSICLNCTHSEKAILEQNVIMPVLMPSSHHRHRHHRHGHHGHHHHHGHGHHGNHHHHHGHGHHGHHHHRDGHHGQHHYKHRHHGHGHDSNRHHVSSHHV